VKKIADLSSQKSARNSYSLDKEETTELTPLTTVVSKVPINYEILLQRCIGNTDIVAKILKTFHDTIQQEIEKIRQSIESQDGENLALTAHALKGAAGNVAAQKLEEIAFCLEKMGYSGELDKATKIFTELNQEVKKCLQYLPHLNRRMQNRKSS
jgi:HPt (histidine-containing phosphotransfer) domain-containing protein